MTADRRSLLFAIALVVVAGAPGCARRAPVVRGLPTDDPGASLSAVWIGHASVLLRFGSTHVMTDPNLNGTLIVVPRQTAPSVTPSELPPVKAVVVSHLHLDHFDRWTLKRLGAEPVLLFPSGGEKYAHRLPQKRRIGLKRWEKIELGEVTITAVPVEHSGGRYVIDAIWNRSYCGYVIEGAGRTVFFAGDTGPHPEYFREIGKRFPKIDLALIPIAPSLGDRGSGGHVGPVGALDIFADVRARYMIPIHYEAYYGWFGTLDKPRQRLLSEVKRRNLGDRVFALFTGERWLLPISDTSVPEVRRFK